MPKRKHAFGGHLEHGYGGYEGTEHRGVRRHRQRINESAMEVAGQGAVTHNSHATRSKMNEAHLIPGVTGNDGTYGFPNQVITKIRYCDMIRLSSAFGAIGFNSFCANGIFDPDITGVGHQPMWRDNFAAIYDQYVVLGSKITVHFTPVTSAQNFVVGCLVDDDSTFSTVLDNKMESNNSSWILLSALGSEGVTLAQVFAPSMFGVKAKDDGASSTSVGANPTEQITFGIWTHCTDATVATASVDCTIEIEYTVKFAETSTQVQN